MKLFIFKQAKSINSFGLCVISYTIINIIEDNI